jgi:cyclohexa-1,5-dienecarbonyl-CoA hydratase
MPVDLSFNAGLTRASLVFQHPTGNILTLEVMRQIRAALEDLLESRHLRLLTIQGAGADFCFGASVVEHTREHMRTVLPEMHALIRDLIGLPVPTAAVVSGRCLGGGFELALACDYIFAAEDATFGLPEIKLGAFPPAASVLLPRRVGVARSTAAILAGDSQGASSWRDAGLVTWTAPAASLNAETEAWFERTLARHSAEALRHAVRVARRPIERALGEELDEVERLYLLDLGVTHDATEGVRAFLEKRAPHWKDE